MGSKIEIKNLKELLKNKVEGKILEEKITRLTANGENYCSLMLKLDLEIQKNGTKETLHTVAKCLPIAQETRKMLGFTMINEVQWYSDIMNLFKEFQKENGFEQVADFFPEMIAARLILDPEKTDEVHEDSVLILENLILQGFKNEDRYIGFNLDQSRSILRRLATFAAVFIGFKLKKPQIFENQIKKYLKELPPPPKNEEEDKARDEEVGYYLKALNENADSRPFVDRIKPILKREFFGLKPHLNEPWVTVSHSDFWINNIMVKDANQNEEIKVKFVDFQMCRYRSFAADLVFFLLTSVKTDVQKKHFEELIKYYYEEFTKILKKLDLDITLSYDDYLEEIKTVAENEEIQHSLLFSTIIFGQKNAEYDPVADPTFDCASHIISMVKNMSQLQKDKLAVMTSVADRMKWI